MATHPTVPLQSLHQSAVSVWVEVQAIMRFLEVQIFVSGRRLGTLLARGAALVGGALQVVLVVHLHSPRQHIVHHYQTDGNATTLDAVKTVELGQQCPGVLIQILQQTAHFMLHRDEINLSYIHY